VVDELRSVLDESPLFSPAMLTDLADPLPSEALSRAILQWSNWFHRGLDARAASEGDPSLKTIFEQHSNEEAGHSYLLGAPRDGLIRQPLLLEVDTIGAWFLHYMCSSAPLVRILVHIILEGASQILVTNTDDVRIGYKPLRTYLDAHAADAAHVDLGVAALRDLSPGLSLGGPEELRVCTDGIAMLARLFSLFATAIRDTALSDR
jgi:hypothetical protein